MTITLVVCWHTVACTPPSQHTHLCTHVYIHCSRDLLQVLGLGAPWEGFLTKFHLILQRLAAPDVGPGTVVVFVDAYDVAFVHPLSVLVHKFLRSGHAVVFGGECA